MTGRANRRRILEKFECPHCHEELSKVWRSERKFDQKTGECLIVRVRLCVNCEKRFKTEETLQKPAA
jgi:transcriptional regulator NrdR family protein